MLLRNNGVDINRMTRTKKKLKLFVTKIKKKTIE